MTLQDLSFRPPSNVPGYLEMIPELFMITRRMEVESCEAAGRGGWWWMACTEGVGWSFADGEWAAGRQVSHPAPTMKTDRRRILAWSYWTATTKLSQGEAWLFFHRSQMNKWPCDAWPRSWGGRAAWWWAWWKTGGDNPPAISSGEALSRQAGDGRCHTLQHSDAEGCFSKSRILPWKARTGPWKPDPPP